MSEWHDNMDLWSDFKSIIFTPERMEQAQHDVEQIFKLLDLKSGLFVLDLGCGVGRHALEFAKRNCKVTGVDRISEYLDQAKETSTQQMLDVEWIQADMREFKRDNTFDVIVNLLTSFGYFENPQDDRKVVTNVYASLKSGGRFVLDLMGKEVLAKIYRDRDWHEEPDGSILLEERNVNSGWDRLDVRWIVLKGSERREHRFFHRVYSANELKTLLVDVGFSQVDVYGSLAGIPYDHHAQRLVLVAQK